MNMKMMVLIAAVMCCLTATGIESEVVGKDLLLPNAAVELVEVTIGGGVGVYFISHSDTDENITVTLNEKSFNVTIPANSGYGPEIGFPTSLVGDALNITVVQNGTFYQRVNLSPRMNSSQKQQLGKWVAGTFEYVDQNGSEVKITSVHEATYYMAKGATQLWYGKWDDLPLI